ncbi:subunit alpha of sodium/potassium-transporting ATPase [Hamiltosporidium magnivora]|uniref:Subunit alpha of sodium/potassium-transporting ATPase n=1 Tax=Hamiltosporidium magnivora TaxID=148818 RepID=A0A4Q9LEC9_9MICR|nr:subunit alpha of sodium/potassium-transporting ATPase [Hamiltosporidium magnivora]
MKHTTKETEKTMIPIPQTSENTNKEMSKMDKTHIPMEQTSHISQTQSKETNEHTISLEELFIKYTVDPDKGRTAEEIETAKLNFGENTFSKPKKDFVGLKFFKIYFQSFNILLTIASFMSFTIYLLNNKLILNLYLSFTIIIVCLLNTLMEFYQEYKAAEIIKGFNTLVPQKARVIRNGVEEEIFASEIVVGDILLFKLGEKVGADCRLIYCNELKVNNSSITGESVPVLKDTEISQSDVLHASNLVFSGNEVVSGEGKGIVIKVGNNTILGKIANLTVNKKSEKSQLTEEINDYVKKLGCIAFITSFIFYIIALINGFTFVDNLSFCIGVFIAFVPQGLPATVTILLVIAAKRMASKNVLVKDLRAVETLGSISLLASDKTGTLTKGKMACNTLWINESSYSILKYKSDSKETKSKKDKNERYLEIQNDIQSENISNLDSNTTSTIKKEECDTLESINLNVKNLKELIKICCLCNNAKVNNKNKIVGDPTETALMNFGLDYMNKISDLVIDISRIRENKLGEIPFSSETKLHVVVYEEEENFIVYMKGAPERILNYCSYRRFNDSDLKINDEFKNTFYKKYDDFASNGHRVIGMAYKIINKKEYLSKMKKVKKSANNDNTNDLSVNLNKHNFGINPKDLTFLCTIGILDPPKKGVKDAITQLRKAGIQVVMVTGDHHLTAESIARKITLVSGKTKEQAASLLNIPIKDVKEDQYDVEIISGTEIDDLSDRDWNIILSKREIIFARTSPKQKLKIVEKFQEKGHIVGVSGDGVNDSPALKKAHLGISMNKTASDVSKEAAKMIILDDNFPSIVNGVLEGRLIFSNLKKSIRYILSHITPQVIPFLLFVAFGVPSPMSSLLLMLIDLFTEFLPAVSLAFEPPEGNLMHDPPRKLLTRNIDNINNTTTANTLNNKNTDISDTNPEASNNPNTILEINTEPSLLVRRNILAEKVFLFSFFRKIKNIFLKKETGETLCDIDLLSWAYLEAGTLITLGCLTSFFITLYLSNVPITYFFMSSQDYFKLESKNIFLENGISLNSEVQLDILYRAQSSYFFSILISQAFNLLTCKRKNEYFGISTFRNMLPIYGTLIGLLFGISILYIPAFNYLLLSRPVSFLPFVFPVLFGFIILIWDNIRKYIRKNYNMYGSKNL